MLGVLMAAGLILTERPPELVKPGEAQAYAVWLEGQARKAAGYYAHADCTAAQVRSRSFASAADAAVTKVRPGADLYEETLEIEGCGMADAQALVVFRDAADWRALPKAPGDSLASLSQQREVLPSVILAVRTAAQPDTSCSALEKAQSALVYDTRVIQAAPPGQPWSERWFMSVCGAGYRVDIDFIPSTTTAAAAYDVRIAP